MNPFMAKHEVIIGLGIVVALFLGALMLSGCVSIAEYSLLKDRIEHLEANDARLIQIQKESNVSLLNYLKAMWNIVLE